MTGGALGSIRRPIGLRAAGSDSLDCRHLRRGRNRIPRTIRWNHEFVEDDRMGSRSLQVEGFCANIVTPGVREGR